MKDDAGSGLVVALAGLEVGIGRGLERGGDGVCWGCRRVGWVVVGEDDD